MQLILQTQQVNLLIMTKINNKRLLHFLIRIININKINNTKNLTTIIELETVLLLITLLKLKRNGINFFSHKTSYISKILGH